MWPFTDPFKWTPAERVYGRFAAIVAIFIVQWVSLMSSIITEGLQTGWTSFSIVIKAAILFFFIYVTYSFHRILKLAIRLEEESDRKKAAAQSCQSTPTETGSSSSPETPKP